MARMSLMIHQRVCDVVRRQVPKCGRVLEVSCGAGKNLQVLRAEGYIVRGTNFSEHEGAGKSGDVPIPIDLGVDVMRGLPYEDDQFDAVLLCDVIEHLSDHEAAIAQMTRVLKPGGLLVIVTPNTARLTSRVHYLFTGFLKIKRSFIGFDVPADQSWAFHNYPPHLPTLLYQLHSRGLDAQLQAIEYKPKSLLLWLAMFPLVWPATWWKLNVAEKFLTGTDAARSLHRQVTSFPALCGEALVVLARKRQTAVTIEPMATTLPKWSRRIDASG